MQQQASLQARLHEAERAAEVGVFEQPDISTCAGTDMQRLQQQLLAWNHCLCFSILDNVHSCFSAQLADPYCLITLLLFRSQIPDPHRISCRRRGLHVTASQSGSRAAKTALPRSGQSWPSAKQTLPSDRLRQLWLRQHCSRLYLLQRQTTSRPSRQAMQQCQERVD